MSRPIGSPHRPTQTNPPFSESELQHRIGGGLLSAANPGWQRIELTALIASTVSHLELTVLMADRSSAPIAPTPELGEDLTLLRRVTYRPGRGAWFSLRYTLDPPAEFRVSYNYTYEPQWMPPIPPGLFAADLIEFPRDAVHIPNWLAVKISQARQHPGNAVDIVPPAS